MTVQPFNDNNLSPSQVAARKLDANVASVSPALYAAASKTALTREEKNLIENWTQVKQTHESLMRMSNKEAEASYNKLAPDFQQVLKTYYNTDYANKPTDSALIQNPDMRKALGLDDGNFSAMDVVKSPFRALMHAGAMYGKYLNAIPNAVQNAAINRESFWTRKNFKAAFDGKYLYDEKAADALVTKYGNANAFVAMHILAGETPGAIIDAWGPNDPEILTAINSAFNEKEAFSTMLGDFSRAQLSVGRDTVRWFDKKFNIDPNTQKGIFSFSNLSGAIDGTFQIFADPLTWLTMGGSAVFKGTGEASKLAKGIQSADDVAGYLANPKVAKYFSGYAETIGKYSEAVAAKDHKAQVFLRDKLRTEYTSHATDEELAVWMRPEYGVKDLESFAKIFTGDGAEEFTRLVRGKTAGQDWAREGATFARASRQVTLGAKKLVRDVLFGDVDFAKGAKEYSAIKDALIENGRLDANSGVLDKVAIDAERAGQNAIQRRLERWVSMHPGRSIVYNSDDKVAQTLETFKRQAFLALGRKDLAEYATAHFYSATQEERIALQKSMYELNMRRNGIQGLDGGEEFIKKSLDAHFGDAGSFASTENLITPNAFGIGAGEQRVVNGALHSYAFKDAVAAPDWRAIQEFANRGFLHKGNSSIIEYIPQFIGGAYNNKVTGLLTDLWTTATLIPQLGVRTAIDEGFTYLMYANGALLRNVLNARAAGRVTAAATGSKAAVGVVKGGIQDALTKVTGRKFGAHNFLTLEERAAIEEGIRGNLAKESRAVQDKAVKDQFIDMAMARYGDRFNDMQKGFVRDLLEIHPNVLRHASSRSVAETVAGHSLDRPAADILSGSQLDKLLKAMGYKTGDISSHLVSSMSSENVDIAMFNNFFKTFNAKPYKLGAGKTTRFVNLPEIFIEHSGIKNQNKANAAMNDAMKAFGFEQNAMGKWIPKNAEVEAELRNFAGTTRQFGNYDGLDLGDQFYEFTKTAFSDIYTITHGSFDQFNPTLMAKFNNASNTFVRKVNGKEVKMTRNAEGIESEAVNYNDILHSITFEDYKKLTANHKAQGRIFSDIKFDGTTVDFETWIREHGINGAFEAMARQTDAIMRQPVVHMHYLALRKSYAAEEKNMANRLYRNAMNAAEGDFNEERAMANAEQQAKKFFTMRALEDASAHVLKFSDNPEMQTVFAYNMRTVGRFYRAVEDFHRRMYRLTKDHSLATISRLRLMNQGFESFGAVHTDQNGEKYVVMPMDNVIYSAVDTAIRTITRNTHSVKQPLFDNITFNLTAGNPSFQTDAGMPYLSGPMGSLSVLGVKSILGKFNPTKQLSESSDDFFLGTLGDNVTLNSSITPKFVRNVWGMLSPDEQSQQETSALTQAISYNAANGIMAPDPTDPKYTLKDGTVDNAAFSKDQDEYLKNIRTSAHNIVVTRSLLGMILPMSVQAKDNMDVPDYLKDAGVVSMQSSFYDILDQVTAKYPDAQDPYELALATWMGKNPGKIAYLVSKKSKEIQPLMTYSKQMQNWVIANEGAVKEYGAGAILFAPNTGDFSPGVYNWATAAGITKNVNIEEYYKKVTLQQHVNAYYALDAQQEKDLQGISVGAPDARRRIIKEYQDKKAALKIQVPGLEDYISSGTANADAFNFVNDAYNFATTGKAKIDSNAKQGVIKSYELYTQFVNYCNYINAQNAANAPELKRVEKDKLVAQINEYINLDNTGVVKQYFQYGLQKLINAKSKDATSGINRTVQ